MSRVIQPVSSFSIAPTVVTYLPTGARLLYVVGECSTKPTYDFTVQEVLGDGSVSQTCSQKYCGAKNGVKTHLFTRYQFTNAPAASATAGRYALNVEAGTGVSLQVAYLTGNVDNS